MQTHADWTAIWLSIKVATGALFLIMVPGIACGWVFARRHFPGKALLEAIVHAPLVLPPVITGYLLLLLLGKQSLLGGLLASVGLTIPFTTAAAILAAAVMGFPLLVRAVRLGIELVDPRLEVAAATLGASPMRIFSTITLPLARSGIFTGLTLAFARGLGEFGATIVLAGNIAGETQTIPLAVFSHMQQPGGEDAALWLAGVSVVLSMAALVLSEWHSNKTRKRLRERS